MDEERQFHPIMDGDQYIFNYNENKNTNKGKRTIVIFGGETPQLQHTAKPFLGKIIALRNILRKIASMMFFGFQAMVLKEPAEENYPRKLLRAQNSGALHLAMLRRIKFDPNTKKLSIYFKVDPALCESMHKLTKIPGPHQWIQGNTEIVEDAWYKMECDQFIFSIGQDSEDRRQLCRQIKDDVELDMLAENEMPLGIRTKDKKIHFFGAAAQTIGGKTYAEAMLKWIKKTRINEDSASPAVLAAYEGSIKMHAAIRSNGIQSVNVNMDDPSLIRKLCDAARVKQ